MLSRAQTLATLLALLIGISGCSDKEGREAQPGITPANEARPHVREEAQSIGQLARSLDGYELRLISQCMRKQGFDYRVPTSFTAPPIIEKNYGFSEDEVRNGYPSPPGLPPDPNNAIMSSLPESEKVKYGQALFGTEGARSTETLSDGSGELSGPGDGCIAEARRVMFGSATKGLETVDFATNLAKTALRSASHDPEMDEINKSWSSCMDDKGHSGFQSPDQAVGDADQMPKSQAVRLAQDDRGCQLSLAYSEKRTIIEDRYLTGLLDAKETEIVGARDALREATANAKRELAKA